MTTHKSLTDLPASERDAEIARVVFGIKTVTKETWVSDYDHSLGKLKEIVCKYPNRCTGKTPKYTHTLEDARLVTRRMSLLGLREQYLSKLQALVIEQHEDCLREGLPDQLLWRLLTATALIICTAAYAVCRKGENNELG